MPEGILAIPAILQGLRAYWLYLQFCNAWGHIGYTDNFAMPEGILAIPAILQGLRTYWLYLQFCNAWGHIGYTYNFAMPEGILAIPIVLFYPLYFLYNPTRLHIFGYNNILFVLNIACNIRSFAFIIFYIFKMSIESTLHILFIQYHNCFHFLYIL